MKSRIKVLILVVVSAAGLPLIAWTGTFLYWHLTITRAIRALEANPVHTGMDGGPHPSFYPLDAAGCRSMPYLIRTMKASSNATVLEECSRVIEFHVWGAANGRGGGDETARVVAETVFDPKDPSHLRQEKLKKILDWWDQNGSKHNRWWQVWSGRCR